MTDLQTVIARNREAIQAFLSAAQGIPAHSWTQQPAPGRWSPAQIAEHLAISYEVGLAGLRGEFPGAAAPRLLRPLIRHFFLKPILARGRFARPAKAPGSFQPSATPAAAVMLLPRLQGASDRLATALGAEETAGRHLIDHPIFGQVGLADYIRLQAIHTDHHRKQLPAPASR